MSFHKEEKNTVALLEAYEKSHLGARVVLEFVEGDAYQCQFFTSYESDNCLELDDPDFDEYYELVYKVLKVISPGSNCYKSESGIWLSVNYKHFPWRVTETSGKIIYEAAKQ